MIDPRHIVNLRGRDYPTWPGVLEAATKAGLKSLSTRVLQIPDASNGHLAVVMARAEFADGRCFEDVGDCSPATASPQIAAAALRMASTRSKGRVLRDALGIGSTLLEELPDEERTEPARPQPVNGARNGSGRLECSNPGCGKPLTQGQHDISLRAFGQELCPPCQRQFTRIG